MTNSGKVGTDERCVNRLELRLQSLRAERRGGVAPYITAGDGGLETTLAVLRSLDAAGAACVELGVPFSDPIADGPVLQAAADRALSVGTSLSGILAMLQELRQGSRGHPPVDLPIALMSYANPLLRRGWNTVCGDLANAGVDALIVADLPFEESREMRSAAHGHGIAPIPFVAPTTSAQRVAEIAAGASGFIYVVGRVGVTGSRTEFDSEALEFLQRIRNLTDRALAVGFGIRQAEDVRQIVRYADLAIVGSALVQHIYESMDGSEDFIQAAAGAAARYTKELLKGLT